jgi:hypothetical protein
MAEIDKKVGVFVSYHHQDRAIADAVVQALTSISEQLSVFIDHSGLEGGEDYEDKISKRLQRTRWFIIVCRGTKDMNWCFYEAGQFRAKLAIEQLRARLAKNRIVYLYDGTPPSQFAKFKGTRVSVSNNSHRKMNLDEETEDSHIYHDTDLFELFKQIIKHSRPKPLRDLTEENVRQLMRAGVRRITKAFVNREELLEEIQCQPRISFKLPAPGELGSTGLTPETEILSYKEALKQVFNIAGETTRWGAIKRAFLSADNIEARWIGDMELASREVALDMMPPQTESLCVAYNGTFFRPIISRYDKYRNGAKKCHVAFMPVRNRKFNLGTKTSLLLSGLILSVRFRQRILPILADLKRDDPSESMPLLSKFLKELTTIETEALEFGISTPDDDHDEPTLLDAFNDDIVKSSLRAKIHAWTIARTIFFRRIVEAQRNVGTAADATKCLLECLADIEETNGQFIEKITEELLSVQRKVGKEDQTVKMGCWQPDRRRASDLKLPL